MSGIANEYNVIITKDDPAWIVSNTVCDVDKETSEVYSGQSFTQTETCTEELERIVTTTRTYDNGTVEKSTKKETAKNELNPIEQIILGTHYENSCKNILSFNPNLNTDGYYNLKLDNNSIVNVYCDMITNGGGYTAYWTEGYHLSINDFASLVESNWVQNSSQFYWHIDNQDGSNLAQVFTTFDNTHTHWFDNHTGGDGAGTVEDPNLNATWDVIIPSLNINMTRTGIVRAIPYLDVYEPYNSSSYGIHYKRTIRGEHYPWFNADGSMRTEGYLCSDASICEYNYGTISNKEHILLFK